MGATTEELFGQAGRPAPATPGSYGEAPAGFRLPDATRLGPVRLQISDLARALAYYETVLGLRTLERGPDRALLAAHGDDAPLLELRARPGARPRAPRGGLGLYHFAILLPDRAALGRFVRHVAELGVRAGAGDHLVSEAFYLQDPDGLGIEVYADRPRETWRRVDRQLMMATDPVDVADLVRAAGDAPWTGMPDGTVMGHVHLHVGDLAQARAFYSEVLGFDRIVWRYPGALFLGAGGYHHHLGTNSWAGPDAQPAADGDARLLEWTVVLPDAVSVDAAAASLAAGGFPAERDGTDLVTRDPWGTQLRVVVARATRSSAPTDPASAAARS